MIPLKVKGKIYLDAFAPMSSTPTILFETATKRCHRPNRNLWAEIEYLLKLRIDTMHWTAPDRDELRTQLEQAEYNLKLFKTATVEEQKELPRPQLEIAGIAIRWVKGHDKKSLATSQITKQIGNQTK